STLDLVYFETYVKRIQHFFFSSRRRHTRSKRDWSSDVCSSDLAGSQVDQECDHEQHQTARNQGIDRQSAGLLELQCDVGRNGARDRKSTRLNSSHVSISYAVFCLKKKKNKKDYNNDKIK